MAKDVIMILIIKCILLVFGVTLNVIHYSNIYTQSKIISLWITLLANSSTKWQTFCGYTFRKIERQVFKEIKYL